jgi:hypothetical protein
MDIKAELDKLKQSKYDLEVDIRLNKDRLSKLNSTIKQLEKLSGKVMELIEDSPVIELGTVETLKEVTKGLV